MTQFAPGMILEGLLVVLLLLTFGYCVVLNRRLSRLRESQTELRAIIGDLTSATATAELAIRGLRATTDDAEARLSDKLHKAQLLARELTVLADDRVTQTVASAPAPTPTQSPAKPARSPEQAPLQVSEKAPVASTQRVSRPGAPNVENAEQWRRHALSRLKRAS